MYSLLFKVQTFILENDHSLSSYAQCARLDSVFDGSWSNVMARPTKNKWKVQLTALLEYINILSLWIDLSILVVEQRSWPLTTPLSYCTSFCKTYVPAGC